MSVQLLHDNFEHASVILSKYKQVSPNYQVNFKKALAFLPRRARSAAPSSARGCDPPEAAH